LTLKLHISTNIYRKLKSYIPKFQLKCPFYDENLTEIILLSDSASYQTPILFSSHPVLLDRP